MVEQADVFSAECILANSTLADSNQCILLLALQISAYDGLEACDVRIALQHSIVRLAAGC